MIKAIDSGKSKGNLISKTFFGIMIVNMTGMVSGSVCILVDSIVTGQFLGTEAVTAAGLLSPVLLIFSLIGAVFGPGAGVVCSRYMGMAKRDRVNQVFSIVMITLTIIGIALSVLLFALAPPLASALSGNVEGGNIRQMIVDYLRGYSFGLLPMFLSLSLSGLMMLDNDRKRGVTAMIVTLAADIVLDLTNALFIHAGMGGMAIATSISNLAGLLVILMHFRRKDRILHLTRKGLQLGDLKETLLCGFPGAIGIGSQALRGFCFNAFLLSIAGGGAVASIAVSNSIFSIISPMAIAVFTSTSSICSLLYGEEDRKGCEQALGLSLRTMIVLFILIAAILLLFAHPVSRLFLESSAVNELNQAARFVRVMALQYLFGAVSFSLSGAYQGTRRLVLNYLIDILRECVLPIMCVLLLGKWFGIPGVEAGFVAAGILTLVISMLVIPGILNHRISFAPRDLLILPEDFGPKPEELFEVSVRSMEEVMDASRRIMAFCREHGVPERITYLSSLFIEEMAGNTLQHGFAGREGGSVDLRLVCREEMQVIRLRDNGMPFDPAGWLERNHPEDPASGIGIRMMVGLAKEIRYMPAMDLNLFMVRI